MLNNEGLEVKSTSAADLSIAFEDFMRAFEAFKETNDQRLSEIELKSSALDALATQRNKLAGAELPKELHPDTQAIVRRAIEESFVSGFRVVMGMGALLAVGSAASAVVLLRAESRKA